MRVRFTLTTGVMALSIALLAGCGGEAGKAVAGGVTTGIVVPPAAEAAPSDEDTPSGDVDAGPAESASEPAPEGAASESVALPEPVTRAVDKTGWYDGFAITVREVTAEPSSGGHVGVTVELMMENLGTDPNYPADPDVTADGLAIDGIFDAPEIPGGGKAEGTVSFGLLSDDPDVPLDPDAALDSVVLTYGTADDNQTIIPLAEDAEVTSDEPITLEASGALQQDQIIVEVKGGDLTPSYEPGEKGKALLTLQIALSCDSECSDYGYNVNQPEFSVTAPDGQSVVADGRSGYCCTAVYPGTVDDSAGNTLVFVVTMPGTGDYTLTYENPQLADEGAEPATFEFTA